MVGHIIGQIQDREMATCTRQDQHKVQWTRATAGSSNPQPLPRISANWVGRERAPLQPTPAGPAEASRERAGHGKAKTSRKK